MNVGFYYHLGSVVGAGEVSAPSHIAVFVSELARLSGRVTYYGHSDGSAVTNDTRLDLDLVRGVSLGPRRSAPARTLMSGRILRRFDPVADGVDVMLVRAPTPLLPAISRRSPLTTVLMVGDYRSWRPSRVQPWWRNLLVRAWIVWYTGAERRALRKGLVLANNTPLADAARRRGATVAEVFTSSLSDFDLASIPPVHHRLWAPDVGRVTPLRLLYAGRISEEKGLLESIEALAGLSSRGWNASLDLFGTPDDPRFQVVLEERARERHVEDRVRFHGHVPSGAPLLRRYGEAHVFLMPSRAEGFPRSIVEAMAVGLPVVATSVGGIPHRLRDRETALLVAPGSVVEIVDAVEALGTDEALRRTIIEQARRWAEGYTNERSCALIVDHLRSLVQARAAGPS